MCRATVSFLRAVVGILLPTALAAATWRPSGPPPQQAQRPATAWGRAARRLCAALATADAWLQESLLGYGGAQPLQAVLMLYSALMVTWWLCRASASLT